MIRVRFCQSNGNHILEMTGHADYNPGNDIVCAGASAIAYTLIGSLTNLAKDEISYSAEPGELNLVCPVGKNSEILFHGAIIGLLQLQQKYPDNISVIVDGYKNFARE